MFTRNYTKLIQEALAVQTQREAASKEPYDDAQRAEAVCQLVEQRLGKRPAKLKEQVRHVIR